MIKVSVRTITLFLLLSLVFSMVSCTQKENNYEGSYTQNETETVLNSLETIEQYNGLDVIARDGNLELLLDQRDASIWIKNIFTGKVWATTGATNDLSQVALDDMLSQISSQIVIEYYDNRGTQIFYNSLDNCIKDKQFSFNGLKQGVRINYKIGKLDSRVLLPDVITAKTMENVIFSEISEEDIEYIKRYYKYFDPTKLDDDTINQLAGKYPLIKTEALYISQDIGLRFKAILIDVFTKSGFTLDMMQEEYDNIGYAFTYDEQPCFFIPVDYTLDNGMFQVSIDCSAIEYNSSLGKLTAIQVLPYFASMNKEEVGYMFIPDGSGITINADSTKEIGLDLTFYGDDENDKTQYDYFSNSQKQNAIMPVFGMKKNSEALFAIIEEGSGIAQLTVRTSQDVATINHITPTFQMLHRETSSSNGMIVGKQIVRYSEKSYSGHITIRYNLLYGNEANYIGMAKYYRNYLFGSRERYEVKTPIYLTSLGVVNRQEKMIGIPVNKERALTEYEEAQKMLEALTAYGIDKISFRYLNWIKDEYDSTVIQKLKPNSILGGKTSFEKLCGYIKENGLQFYPNLQLVFVGRDNYFNKYSGLNHSALPLDKICTLKNGYLLNSESILNLSQTFPSQLNELPVSTISIDTIGSNLYSDYSDNNTVLREEAIDNYTEVLKNLSKDYSLMTSVGNSYTLQYVTDVLELPLTSSKYYIESDSVPFVEMVLHGYINYAGQPINLQTDTTDAFLKSIETGAGLSFLLNVSEVELIKNTKYTNLFSSSFEEWDEIIQGYYLSSSELYEQTKGAVITNHEKVSDNVFKTIYDNGIETYVNYDESTYGQDGIVVEGKSFSIVTKQEGN